MKAENERRIRWPRYIFVAFCCLLILGAIASMVARDIQTAPHEVPLATPVAAGLGSGVSAQLYGCMIESAEGSSLRVRALSLLPRAVISSEAGETREVTLVLANVARHRTRLEGAPCADAEDAATVQCDLSVSPGERRELKVVPDGSAEAFTFYVVGDTQGRYEVMDCMIDDANREMPLFVLNLGDLAAYNKREELEAHRRAALRMPVPYFTAIGDHDLLKPGLKGDQYADIFGPTYYAFSYGNWWFAVLDNAGGYVSPQQVKWLADGLSENGGRHTFVFAHQPLFDPRRGEHHAMKPLIGGAEAVRALLEMSGVRFFFAGHIHTYYEVERNGVRHIITGGGGGDLKPPFPRHHYVAVTVAGDDVRWEIRQTARPGLSTKRE